MRNLMFAFLVLLSTINDFFAQPQTIWEKTFGGSRMEWGGSCIQTSDGHWLFAGMSASSDGDVPGSAGGFDTWVFKTDTTGNIIWSKNFGGSEQEEGGLIAENPDGTFWVIGETHSFDSIFASNKGKWDIFVLKLSAAGDLLLSKTFGGTGADDPQNFVLTDDGGLIFAASTWSDSGSGDVIYNHGERDCWLVKLNADAEIEWQKSIGGSNHDYGTIYTSIHGGYWLAADSRSNDGDFPMLDGTKDHWLLRLDDFGNIIWKQRLGLPDEMIEFQVAEDANGHLAVMQRFFPDDRIEMAKYSIDGMLLEETNLHNIFPEGSYWRRFSYAADGGFYFFGVDSSHTGFLTQTDASFQIIWQKEFPFDGLIIPGQVMALSDHSLLVVGLTSPDFITFDPDQNTQIWVAKLDDMTSSVYTVSNHSSFIISPNPISEGQPLQIMLENEFLGTISFEILSLDGRVISILEKEKTLRKQVFQMDDFPGHGSFLVRMSDGYQSAVRIAMKF